jgi:hypothetical protein
VDAGGDSGGNSDAGGDSGSSSDAGGDSGAPGFGQACAVDKDCTDATYNSCQLIQHKMICTKSCKAASQATDCPAPPTSGTCNKNGYCI